MSCNDKAIAQKLTDYFSGHLNESETAEVENHLAQCSECRQTLALMDKLGGHRVHGDHPDREILIQYYHDPSAFSEGRKAQIRAHLEDCRECAYEYAFLRDMERDLAASAQTQLDRPGLLRRFFQAIPAVLRKPAVAYFLLALTIYPAVRYLTQGPSDEPNWAARSVTLTSMDRSDAEVATVTRRSDSDIIGVTIPQYHNLDQFEYQFEVRDSSFSREIAVELISDLTSRGSIGLLVNTRDMDDGLYTISVVEVDRIAPEDTTRHNYPLRLVTR